MSANIPPNITDLVEARAKEITAILERLAATSQAMRQSGATELEITSWASGELVAAGLLTEEQASRAIANVKRGEK